MERSRCDTLPAVSGRPLLSSLSSKTLTLVMLLTSAGQGTVEGDGKREEERDGANEEKLSKREEEK